MNKEKVTVIFQPSGRRGQVEAGKTILEAAQTLGVAIESVCGGKHTCGKCKVRVENEGNPSPESPLSLFSAEEGKFIGKAEQVQGVRLACAAQVYGDASIFIPEESRGTRPVIRKEAGEIFFDLNPGVKGYFIEIPPPDLANPLADFERLQEALRKKWGLTDLTIDFPTLQILPQRLRSNGWKIKAFIWMEKEVLDIQPGDTEDYYGVAIDIGTTTLAAYLCNLGNGRLAASAASMNPQVAYGEDIMARITYSMMNPGEGIKRLRDSITEGLNGLIKNVTQAAGITAEQILELTVVGNTAMHHIFLGIDPQFIGVAPFPPAVHRSLDLKARDLGLMVHPAANVHVLPIEAGFVGADNVGVLISQVPYEQEEMVLIIDIGTNGELLLGNKHRLLSCSCATGPALEGGHLQFGMRAAPGAIEHVRIDRKTLEVRFQVIGQEKWNQESVPADLQARGICGSGIIEAIAEMFKAGILTASGRFNPDIQSPRLRANEKGPAFVIARTEETAIGQEITISIGDIRAVQLAKGALYSGAKVMMGILGVDKLDKVLLAGGFGSYIDGPSALLLGMFPDCELNNIIAVGNAAGDGARLALLDRKKRAEADRLARQVEYIELTTQSNFMMAFVEAMAIPHFKDSFPHLKAAGLLP